MADVLTVPRDKFETAIRTLDALSEQVRVLGETIAREIPDFARVERQLFEWGGSPEACEKFAAIVKFARDLQVAAVKVKVAAQTGSRDLRLCDPELTPARSPSQMALQAFRASSDHALKAKEALKK